MRKETFFYRQGINYKRVTKTIAHKYYNEGCNIIIAPVNANMYYMHFDLWLKTNINEYQDSFERLVNNFSWYNCNSELGNYCKYFVNEYDLKKGL